MKFSGNSLFRSLMLMVVVSTPVFARPVFAASEFVIYRFPESRVDGCSPHSGLITNNAGNLYGVADCGSLNKGVVYELVRPVPPATGWVQHVIYNFAGSSDGQGPLAPLTIDAAGNLYGTAGGGGDNRVGIVFRLSPPATEGESWTKTTIYTFTGATTVDGENPNINGVIFDAAGNLYGATSNGGTIVAHCRSGCGTVYKLTPPATEGAEWTETTLHFFNFGQGAIPLGTPTLDSQGNLYGVASDGGLHAGGVAYRLLKPTTPGGSWNYKVIYSFGATTTDSKTPMWNLTFHGSGILYGTAREGGHSNVGTVFQLTPPSTPGGPWTENVLHSFAGNSDGAVANGNVIFDKAGNLYGTTLFGGGGPCTGSPNGCGIAYELSPPTSGVTWSEIILHAFFASATEGWEPSGGLVQARNGVLFGVTSGGTVGPFTRGTIFGIVP
jgi:uncharacterized repeat protein (TIGR03803 family)